MLAASAPPADRALQARAGVYWVEVQTNPLEAIRVASSGFADRLTPLTGKMAAAKQ